MYINYATKRSSVLTPDEELTKTYVNMRRMGEGTVILIKELLQPQDNCINDQII